MLIVLSPSHAHRGYWLGRFNFVRICPRAHRAIRVGFFRHRLCNAQSLSARSAARARPQPGPGPGGQGHDQGHARTRFPHLAMCDAETRVPHRTCFCFSNIHECATRDLGPTSHGGRGRAEPGRASTCDAGLGPKPSDLRRGDQGPTSHVASFKHPGMCDAGPGSHIPWRAMPGRA